MLWHSTIGNGPNLVLLHGWAFNSDIFLELVNRYKKDYRVTIIDLPGHGRSKDLDGGIENWCNEIINLIPEKSILLGWSLGGLLSIYIANKIKLRKLILVAASPCLVNNDNWSFGIKGEVFNQFSDNLKIDSTKALKRFVSLQTKNKSQIKELHKSIQRYPASQSALNNGLDIIVNSDLRQLYRDITTPKKCILGNLDTLVPAKIQDWFEDAGAETCLLYTSPSPRDLSTSRMPSSA